MHVRLCTCVYHWVLRVGVGVYTCVRERESESRGGEERYRDRERQTLCLSCVGTVTNKLCLTVVSVTFDHGWLQVFVGWNDSIMNAPVL